MKKLIKSRIFLVIITTIIVASVSVYAATTYKASDVIYNSSNGTSMNVSDALNELYNDKSNNLNGLSIINFGFTIQQSNELPYGSVGLVFENLGAKEIYIPKRGNLNTCIYASNEPITLGGVWDVTYTSTGTLKLFGSWGNTYDISEYKYIAIGWSFRTDQYQNNGGFPFSKNIVTTN